MLSHYILLRNKRLVLQVAPESNLTLHLHILDFDHVHLLSEWHMIRLAYLLEGYYELDR